MEVRCLLKKCKVNFLNVQSKMSHILYTQMMRHVFHDALLSLSMAPYQTLQDFNQFDGAIDAHEYINNLFLRSWDPFSGEHFNQVPVSRSNELQFTDRNGATDQSNMYLLLQVRTSMVLVSLQENMIEHVYTKKQNAHQNLKYKGYVYIHKYTQLYPSPTNCEDHWVLFHC